MVALIVIASAVVVSGAVLPIEIYPEWLDLIEIGRFVIPYLRLLTLAAFQTAASSSPEVAQLVEPVMQSLLTNEIELDEEFQRNRAHLFRPPIEMPIVAAALQMFPGFVTGGDRM
jgi:hypothetical protein